MLAIQGIYNGTHIVPLEALPVVASIQDMEENEEDRPLLAQNAVFQFWENEQEDLYQEYL